MTVQHGDRFKPAAKPANRLRRQADLRHEHDRLPAVRHRLGNGADINFCLAAAGHAMQHEGLETGLALRRDGRIAASMPLHGVEAVVSEMRWDATLTWVALVGDGVNYTYRIPEEVLRHRSAKAGTAVTGDV